MNWPAFEIASSEFSLLLFTKWMWLTGLPQEIATFRMIEMSRLEARIL
jgi:hypothetical protein